MGLVAQCTAPREGHRTASGAANCPVHGGRYGGYGAGYYPPRTAYTPSTVYAPAQPRTYPSYASRSSGRSGRSSSSRSRRLMVTYSATDYKTLNPVHEQVVRIAKTDTDRRDLGSAARIGDSGSQAASAT
ncbi:hypothetical protein CELD12_15890 [Cellulomonas sp. NTE-D12]|nr:hypothetical protein CELD12_15890 [Cellulomonas sp. NTE-D12]